MSRMAFACLLPLLTASASAAWAGGDGHAAFERQARITISPEGKVTSLQFVNTQATKDVLGERLDPVIRTWSFEPGHVDGNPVVTETTLHLLLDMRKSGADSYAITLLGAQTGVGTGKVAPPDYPAVEMADGIEAKVSLLISVSVDGTPGEVRAEHVQSTGGSNDNARFVKASVAIAKQWTYTPEIVGGHALPSTVRVPVEFCLSDRECRGLAADPKAQPSWGSGSVATLDSQAKLVTQVAGTTF